MDANATQRIIKIRRDYNSWVADETLEDYALRFTPHSFRKWSEFRVANTAMGAVSFLALEAIGGALALNYGFVNAFWAIVAVSLLIFLTGLPIAYYAAKYGLDMDLLTRGAGFGYIGSTITSLIYASFTFIFFALEAAIMALAIQLSTGLPLSLGYLLCALGIIPLVTYGITLISRLQTWTQPVWLVLLVVPYAAVLYQDPGAIKELMSFTGNAGNGGGFSLLLFGAAAAVASALITQIGEQVDFLRFMPEKTAANRKRWWAAVICAGPGWIVPGAAKMLGGAFLAYLVVKHGIGADKAVDPTQMYLLAYRYVFDDPRWALAAMTLFVIVAQVKINVTNAYAGSLAWSNFFARVTHSHPGRVVWLVFNVLIAIVLMELGVFDALEHVLAVFSHIAIAWIGALVADLVVNKPLGLSPPGIEFRRAYLYDINPVGVGSMLISFVVSLSAFGGMFGLHAQALSPFLALLTAFAVAPLIAVLTRGRYNLARPVETVGKGSNAHTIDCVICSNAFERADMAQCPAYGGAICSLCCTLDARCQDRCKTNSRLGEQISTALARCLPKPVTPLFHTRLAHYLIIITMIGTLFAAILGLFYYQEAVTYAHTGADIAPLRSAFIKIFATLLLTGGVAAWWLVLTNESRLVAQEESDRQTHLLLREIEAHSQTDAKLEKAREVAESANLAKSRFMTGMSHELRAPLNGILGYAQILQRDPGVPPARREAVEVIHRSGRHLIGLIDGLLDISRIEAGKFRLEPVETHLGPFLDQIIKMFQPQMAARGLHFDYHADEKLPAVVQVDEKRLRQILINLLGNAVKFTATGFISFRVRYASDMAQFEIEDSGPGIPAGDLDRIFLAFERSWAATDQADTGTGLGLTICQMLTHIMGGELTVRSQIGRGSVFTLKLFLPEMRAPRSGLPANGIISGYEGAPRQVLVVDDQMAQRGLLRDMLVPLGFEVIEAGSGAECIMRMNPGPGLPALAPDALLMDVSMPGMTGWETCAKLRERGIEIPIIMVSANAYEAARDVRLAGHTDFVTKPVMMDDLLGKLGRHIGLTWTVATADITPPRLQPADVRHLSLTRADAESLLELGAMGYVKGILCKIEEIRVESPHNGPLLDVLLDMAREFRLSEYQSFLKQEMQRHGSRAH